MIVLYISEGKTLSIKAKRLVFGHLYTYITPEIGKMFTIKTLDIEEVQA